MAPDTRLTVTLYLRADESFGQRRDEILHRLDDLEQDRRIRHYDLQAWPRSICLTTGEELGWKHVLDTVRSFERWAIHHGIGLRPPFTIRRTESSITGERDRRVVLPVVCLAAYEDDELVGVFPCRCGDRVLSVEDALESLEAGGLSESAVFRRSETAESPEIEPDTVHPRPRSEGDGTVLTLRKPSDERDER